MKVCPKCQVEFPDEYAFCAQCATPLAPKQPSVPASAETPPAAGKAPEPPAPMPGPTLGSLGARFVAHLIDLFVLGLAYWLAGTSYGAFFGGLTESGFDLSGLPAVVVIAASSLVFLVYLIVFEGVVGATPGKFILGLRVKTVEGGRCDFGRALIRNVLRIVDAIAVYLVGLIVALVSKKRQRVGDLAAHTIVAREAHGPAKRVGAALFLVLCLVGTIFGSLYLRKHARVPPGGFGIANLRFADSDSAPPRANTEYKPEEEVRLFYEVPGYERDSESNIAVVTQHQVLAPDGKPFFEIKTIEVRQKAGEDAGPVKCNFHIGLPPWAPPGNYTISIQAEDQIAQDPVERRNFFGKWSAA